MGDATASLLGRSAQRPGVRWDDTTRIIHGRAGTDGSPLPCQRVNVELNGPVEMPSSTDVGELSQA